MRALADDSIALDNRESQDRRHYYWYGLLRVSVAQSVECIPLFHHHISEAYTALSAGHCLRTSVLVPRSKHPPYISCPCSTPAGHRRRDDSYG